MSSPFNHRITLYVAAAGVALTGVAFLLGGLQMGVGALIGTVVSVANWLAMRWVGRKVATAPDGQRNGLMLLLVAKMGALGAICFLLIVKLHVDVAGLAMGLGAMVFGVLLGGRSAQNSDGSDDSLPSHPGDQSNLGDEADSV